MVVPPNRRISVTELSGSEPFHSIVLPRDTTKPALCPWARVVRQEANTDKHSLERTCWYVADCLPVGFFEEYLNDHALPFFELFAGRAARQEAAPRRGGEVDSIDNWEWDQIRPAAKRR